MPTMHYRRLGASGLKISELSFGSWVACGNQMGEPHPRECMAAAHDAGVNFFDNELTRSKEGSLPHRLNARRAGAAQLLGRR
jgi:hypothetical protein